MLDQILITGISGAIVIFMIMGLGKAIRISKLAKTENSWEKAISSVLGKNFISWLSILSFLAITVIIILGLIISIIFT